MPTGVEEVLLVVGTAAVVVAATNVAIRGITHAGSKAISENYPMYKYWKEYEKTIFRKRLEMNNIKGVKYSDIKNLGLLFAPIKIFTNVEKEKRLPIFREWLGFNGLKFYAFYNMVLKPFAGDLFKTGTKMVEKQDSNMADILKEVGKLGGKATDVVNIGALITARLDRKGGTDIERFKGFMGLIEGLKEKLGKDEFDRVKNLLILGEKFTRYSEREQRLIRNPNSVQKVADSQEFKKLLDACEDYRDKYLENLEAKEPRKLEVGQGRDKKLVFMADPATLAKGKRTFRLIESWHRLRGFDIGVLNNYYATLSREEINKDAEKLFATLRKDQEEDKKIERMLINDEEIEKMPKRVLEALAGIYDKRIMQLEALKKNGMLTEENAKDVENYLNHYKETKGKMKAQITKLPSEPEPEPSASTDTTRSKDRLGRSRERALRSTAAFLPKKHKEKITHAYELFTKCRLEGEKWFNFGKRALGFMDTTSQQTGAKLDETRDKLQINIGDSFIDISRGPEGTLIMPRQIGNEELEEFTIKIAKALNDQAEGEKKAFIVKLPNENRDNINEKMADAIVRLFAEAKKEEDVSIVLDEKTRQIMQQQFPIKMQKLTPNMSNP